MWKEPTETSPNPDTATSDSAATSSSDTSPSGTSSSGIDADRPQSVKVRLIRPDGSARDVVVTGHFREEHLCSLVDDELCRLDDGDSLVLHLFRPDDELTASLRNRWQEGMSDNRQVHVREVLGPNNDRQQLAAQLQSIRERMANGERVHLAIRSPRVAKVARQQLRKLLLISQQFEESLLNLWVHGSEAQQQEILGHLEAAGMVRERDYHKYAAEHTDHRWRAPWIDIDVTEQKRKKVKRRSSKHKTSDEAVTEWIKRVEEGRDHSHH